MCITYKVRAVLGILTGIILLCMSSKLLKEQYAFNTRALQAEAMVIDFTVKSDYYWWGGKDTYYFPILSWQDPNGRFRKVYATKGKKFSAYDIGTKVPVSYDPSNYADVRFDSQNYEWRVMILGIIMIMMGIIVFFLDTIRNNIPKRAGETPSP